MQNAVMAIWHHSQSTDESPDHDLCPDGENSWCGLQRDIAKGTSDYKHEHPLPKAVANAIFPHLKPCPMKIFLHAVFTGALRTKIRPSMPSSGSRQLKNLTLV